MPIDIRRPSDGAKDKPRLSRLGLVCVGLAVVLVVALGAMTLANRSRTKALAQNAEVIDTAIDHAIAVCESVAAASGGSDRITAEAARIRAEKNPLTRAEMTTALIGNCLGLAGDNTGYMDELNGARNRLTVAVRAYKDAL